MKFVPPGKQIRATTEIGKMVEGGNHCSQGLLGSCHTGATIFQANLSKPRRPLDTVDLEELPVSRDRAGAPVLWLSCESQINIWRCSRSALIWVLSLIDKDFRLQLQLT